MQVLHIDEQTARTLITFYFQALAVEKKQEEICDNFIKEFCAAYGYQYYRMIEEKRFIKPC